MARIQNPCVGMQKQVDGKFARAVGKQHRYYSGSSATGGSYVGCPRGNGRAMAGGLVGKMIITILRRFDPDPRPPLVDLPSARKQELRPCFVGALSLCVLSIHDARNTRRRSRPSLR